MGGYHPTTARPMKPQQNLLAKIPLSLTSKVKEEDQVKEIKTLTVVKRRRKNIEVVAPKPEIWETEAVEQQIIGMHVIEVCTLHFKEPLLEEDPIIMIIKKGIS